MPAVTCPNCGHVVNAPESMVGRTGKCPQCGAEVGVPAVPPPGAGKRGKAASYGQGASTPPASGVTGPDAPTPGFATRLISEPSGPGPAGPSLHGLITANSARWSSSASTLRGSSRVLGYILVVPGVVSAGLGIFQLCNLGGAKAEVLPQLVAVGVVAIILGIWNIAAGVVISSFGATLSSLTEIGQAVLSCVASQARR